MKKPSEYIELFRSLKKRVLTNMMKTYPNRARIITTHRPSMLQYCTRVYKIVDDGILIEDKE